MQDAKGNLRQSCVTAHMKNVGNIYYSRCEYIYEVFILRACSMLDFLRV